MRKFLQTFSILVFTLTACLSFSLSSKAADPLPSWNATKTRQAIVDFVEAVTDPKSKSFVKPEDRIATFDNDGTLWVENPLYTHLLGVFGYMKEQMKADPSLVKREPYKAVASKDMFLPRSIW